MLRNSLIFLVIYELCWIYGKPEIRCGEEPLGWLYRENPPTCYYLSPPDDVVDYVTAVTSCGKLGANLSSLASQEEMDFLHDNLYSCYDAVTSEFWVDLQNLLPVFGTVEERRKNWRWGDGSPTSWHLWSRDAEPDGNDHVARIINVTWGSTSSSTQLRYLCEKALPAALPKKQYYYTTGATADLDGFLQRDVNFESTPVECAVRCSNSPQCAHFLYDVTSGLCGMKCKGSGPGELSFVKKPKI